MFDRRFFAEAVTLVILAAVCGSVANVVAARDRKVAWVGDYPNATVVPQRAPAVTPVPVPDETTTSVDEGVPTEMTESVEPGEIASDVNDETPQTTPAPAQNATPPPVESSTPAGVTPAPTPKKEFLPAPDKVSVEITNEDARQLFDDGAVFLDARRTSAYAEGHIPGARDFAVWEADIDEKVNALFYSLTDQLQPIVIYCTGGNCEDSHMLAQKLWGIGYENVLVYTDGFPGWLSIGGPVER